MARVKLAALRPFSDSGYEILDDAFAETGEVVIWSVSPRTPCRGELFTIERGGEILDLEVRAVVTFKHGWSACCYPAD